MNVAPNSDPQAGSVDRVWHSFTCPVCGHRDRAEASVAGRRTTCPHGEPALVLEAAGPGQERVEASVCREDDSPPRPH